MHIAIIKSVQNGKTYYSKLLRHSFRDAHGRVQKQTLLNLAPLPDSAIDLLKAHLAGRSLVEPSALFEVVSSRPHGAVRAVLEAFRRLDLPRLIASQPSRQRDLVCALIAARLLRPDSKLATARWWQVLDPRLVRGIVRFSGQIIPLRIGWESGIVRERDRKSVV